MLDQQEIRALLKDLESDRVERKASASDKRSIKETICSFANDLPGHGKPGVIFVGADDRGNLTGLSVTDELLKLLANLCGDGSILPKPTAEVDTLQTEDGELAYLLIHPFASPPARFDGRTCVRIGPTTVVASPEDERRLNERRRSSDIPFEMQESPGASLDDVDTEFFQKDYLPLAVADDVLRQNQRSLAQKMTSLRLLSTSGRPTNACLLVMGRDPLRFIPGAYIQFLRIDGSKLTDPIKDEKLISGRLDEVMREIDVVLRLNISTAVRIEGTTTEHRTPDYPLEALRQLARNAVMHRSYEATNAPARIYWFSDRVEIINPGGLFGQVKKENFGKGITDYRNPVVAEAMKTLGFVQRFGMGIPLARKALQENGNPEPVFAFEPVYFGVTLRSRE
ncbi:MAG: ATP-binding protein [Candidatus Brocadiia bacterium]